MRSQVARNKVTWQTSRNLRTLLSDVVEGGAASPDSLGERIALARKEAGLTQDQLADLIGVKMRQVQNYESGDSDPYRKINQIAAATGRSIAWLRGDPEAMGEAEVGRALLDLQEEVRELRRQIEARLPPSAGEQSARKPS